MTQDELETQAGQAASQYVVKGEIVGAGKGSTVNKGIDAPGLRIRMSFQPNKIGRK
jgi:ribose 5-phosphate isomerase A